jgi:cation transport ATPase
VTRLLLLIIVAAIPCAAQFRTVKIWFTGTGCTSCTESMGDRMRRLRGVESAKVNAQEGTLEIQLAETNRVRLEQIRDLIEQDGTKSIRAVVRVRGDLSKTDDRWILQPAGISSKYEVAGPGLAAGPSTIAGEVRDLHASAIRIEASESAK